MSPRNQRQHEQNNNESDPHHTRSRRDQENELDESLKETFPASDPPAPPGRNVSGTPRIVETEDEDT